MVQNSHAAGVKSQSLSTDCLFRVGQFLVADASRQSEQTLKHLCELSPDLAHRMRVAEGGDYSDVRARIKSSFYWCPPQVASAAHQVPSVATSLLAFHQKNIEQGRYDGDIHRHFTRKGFDLHAGTLHQQFQDFSPNDQAWIRGLIKQRIQHLMASGGFDKSLLAHPSKSPSGSNLRIRTW